jgi:hypothetical protein
MPLFLYAHQIFSDMTTGYSGKPLWQKLGIKEEMKILLLNAPADYESLLEKKIKQQLVSAKDQPDLIHLFVATQKEWERQIAILKKLAGTNPKISIWVSWYKKSAGISTDITEDNIRGLALRNGLVDVKVCAVSEEWSGLKLVVPLSKR